MKWSHETQASHGSLSLRALDPHNLYPHIEFEAFYDHTQLVISFKWHGTYNINARPIFREVHGPAGPHIITAQKQEVFFYRDPFSRSKIVLVKLEHKAAKRTLYVCFGIRSVEVAITPWAKIIHHNTKWLRI